MSKFFLRCLPLLFLFVPIVLKAQEIDKQTHTYAVKDGIEMQLDRYYPKQLSADTPCVLFMFGGGFVSGQRDSKDYLNFFEALVKNGFQVVSIDYRKGMRKVKEEGVAFIDAEDLVALLAQTVDKATEDLVEATSFVLEKAKEWQVDSSKIIACGSSAGAVSVLHGEYAVANRMEPARKLPDDFRYAGIISMAGAVFSTRGDLNWKRPPAPMLLFHGNADKSVPYDAVRLGSVGLFGSKYLAAQFEKMQTAYYFYDELYAGHELSNRPMNEQLPLILDFIRKNALARKGIRMHLQVKVNDREPINTNFSIADYVESNFGK